jgi:hypothetical protein
MTTGEGRITVARGGAYVDKARAYKVMLDGTEVGRVKDGKTESFSVPAGAHELNLKVDWATSPTMRFDVAPGEEVRFACRPAGNPFTALLYSLFARKKYLKLEREGGAA